MVRERPPRQALGGHEREREDARERQERADLNGHLLDREARLGERGVVAHPQQGPLVESGQELRERDGNAPDERHAPQHPPLPQQHEQPDAEAAAVDQEHGEAAGDADALVGRAHRLVAAVEGLRHLQDVRQLGQPVAAHDEAQPEAALPRLRAGPLVDERVVDPPPRTLLQGRLHRLVTAERDVPGRAGAGLGDGAGRVSVEGRTLRILRQRLPEAVRRPAGTEAHLRLAHLAPAEVPDDPLVGMERTVAQQPRERLGAAPFELDEAAGAVVHAEARRLPVVRRPPAELAREPPRLGQGRGPVHLEVELDDRERAREVDDGEYRARGGKRRERRPEDRSPEHGSTSCRGAASRCRPPPFAAGVKPCTSCGRPRQGRESILRRSGARGSPRTDVQLLRPLPTRSRGTRRRRHPGAPLPEAAAPRGRLARTLLRRVALRIRARTPAPPSCGDDR